MSDRPTYRPVYKALHRPLTIWGVDRRLFFLALLMGAATFNLFYSFLAGLLMFGGLYGVRAVGDARATRRCCGFCSRPRKARRRYDPGKHDRSTWRSRRGEARAASCATTGGRQRERLLALWGFVDDTTFLTKAGHVGVVYRCTASTTKAWTTRSGRRSCTDSKPAFACSTSLPRLPVPHQADDRTDRRQRPVNSRWRTRPSSGARRI